MENGAWSISGMLSWLRDETNADFAAIALMEEHEQRMRWQYASGNRNERYKKIIFSRKGMIGNVLRSGRLMMIPSFFPKSGDDPSEYAILLAEGLKSAVAVPVMHEESICGVLLVGCRQIRVFTEELSKIVSAAEWLGDTLRS
ncbi:GAF domain-containing protein [Brevibacillus fluminis]|uniref:GAF domain-containing protein n=1 Tax=Brevibacillus fluminis TaxID=511487 RepID=A0A3M8DNY4_9BACL|nr:GAF domain-containing protein [Brevibacillus fluminis]RNB89816.1 GAF domain-containing protein [Brevibacillus fluminis]